jgi:CO/xanthine dehydrogenase Mo-binding subunit
VGAYLSNFSTATPTFLHGTLMAGPYKVPHVYVNVKTVFTNTAPVTPIAAQAPRGDLQHRACRGQDVPRAGS